MERRVGEKELAALGERLWMGTDRSQVAQRAVAGTQEGVFDPFVYFSHDVQSVSQEKVVVFVNAPCE
jgi:hypothetical protein